MASLRTSSVSNRALNIVQNDAMDIIYLLDSGIRRILTSCCGWGRRSIARIRCVSLDYIRLYEGVLLHEEGASSL